jgi:endonuclease/exonuclease/phosphatase family metal-dependent hydrolase
VYKSPGRTRSDADIAELLKLRHKCILAGDLNAKHPSWNSPVSNPSGEISKFLHHSVQPITLLGEMEMYWFIVVHKNIRLSNVIVSDILDSDHLPIIFHILNHVRTHNLSAPAEKFTD